MFEVVNRSTQPWKTICYVEVMYPDGYIARATGVIVGPNDVLTAAHVVYDERHGGMAIAVGVSPGADTEPVYKAPFGEFFDAARINCKVGSWDVDGDNLLTSAESANDLALIGFRTPIGNMVGIAPIQTNVPLPGWMIGTIAGYPVQGTGLMQSITVADAYSVGIYYADEDLGAGASGGPLLWQQKDGTMAVAGVLSSGGNGYSSYAGLFGPGTADWLANALVSNDALMGGKTGTFANDLLSAYGGNDIIDGGAGRDLVAFSGDRNEYSISRRADGAWRVVDNYLSRDGSDVLRNVERIDFFDKGVALDIDGSAGIAARLIGLIFGAAAVKNPSYIAIALKLLDSGMSESALANLALSVKLGANFTTKNAISTVYQSLTGAAPPAADLAYFQSVVQTGQATMGDLTVAASHLPINELRIDLVGLSATGLTYAH